MATELFSIADMIKLVRENAVSGPMRENRPQDNLTSIVDREGLPEQGWTTELEDVAGMIRADTADRIVRRCNRLRVYRDAKNTYTEYVIIPTDGGNRIEFVGCFFIVNPYTSDSNAMKNRVESYWAKVFSGEVVLTETPSCHWCSYGVAVKRDHRFPNLYTSVVCTNRDIVANMSGRERDGAPMACDPARHFKPHGVHLFAAGYFGWPPDPACIERMEHAVRPPIVVPEEPVYKESQESDTEAIQRHHGFWEDVGVGEVGEVPPERQGVVSKRGGGKSRTRRRR